MDTTSLFFQAFVYLCAAVVSVPIARRLGLGSVLGYLLAGVAIGPFGLGLVGREGQDVLHFAEFGVVMMLFLIGLELEPAKLWALRGALLGMGGLQVLGTSALLATSSAAAAGAASGWSWIGLLKGSAAKILLSCVTGAVLGVAVTLPVALTSRTSSTPEPVPSAAVRAGSGAPAPAPLRAAPESEPQASPVAVPIPTSVAVASSKPRTLGAEAELLLQAQRALGSGDAERALTLLDEHQRRHRDGALAQERAASRVLALCAAGRVVAARVEGAAFVRDAPGSPLVPRVRRSCAFAAPSSRAAFEPLTESARAGQ